MAGKDSVIIHIDGDDTGYELSLKAVESKTKKSTNKLQSELKAINGVAVGVATAIGTIGAAVVGLGVKYNAEMEQYKAGFTTMLGSAEQADKTIASLKSFAEKTPFELTDLANASTTLLAFGEDVNNLEADLKMLGDISLGNAEKFKGLSLVFGQVQSQGKLMGQDLLQMINQGFNPLQIISEKTGESMASLKDKMAAGQISFEMVADAMKTATSQGGQFFNAMEAQSKTFTGQVSTLKDNVTSLFGEMSEDISQALTEDVLPKAIEMVGDLKEAWNDGSLQSGIKAAAAVTVTFGTAIAGLNIALFISDLISLKKGVDGFTAATKLGTTAQKIHNAELLKLAKNKLPMTAANLGVVTAALTLATSVVVKSVQAYREATAEVDALNEAYERSVEAADKTLASSLTEVEVAKNLKARLFELEEQIHNNTTSEEEATKAKAEFNSVAEELNGIMPGLINYIGTETDAYAIQEQAVNSLADAYVRLMEKKAYADAYYTKYKSAVEAKIEAEAIYEENKDNAYANGGRGLNAWVDNGSGGKALAADAASKTIEKTAVEADKWKTKVDETTAAVLEIEAEIKSLGGTAEETGKKVVKTAGTTAGAAKKTTDTLKEEFNKQLKDLKYAHESGEKSDEEYYKELGELRNKYFETGSEEWNQYAEEIYKWQKSILTKVKEDSIAAVEEFQKAKEEIVSGLDDDIADTYQTVNIQDGENTLSYTKLADIGAENKKLDEYNEMLDKLFERTGGEFPDYVMQQLKSMNVDEGINYVSAMLRASDSDFEAYINGLEEKAERQGLIADKFLTEDAENLTEKLTEIYGTIPEGFFDIGEDSATEFAEGFGEKLALELKNIMDSMAISLNSFASPILSGVAGGNQYANNYYNNYYLQSGGESNYAQIKALDDHETYKKMTNREG